MNLRRKTVFDKDWQIAVANFKINIRSWLRKSGETNQKKSENERK